MHPVRNLDALVLLATALAAKRRPASLAELLAALELLESKLPPETQLGASLERLVRHGLVTASDGRLALSELAQELVSGMPRKGETAERVFLVREKLSACATLDEHPGLGLGPEAFAEALAEHRAAAKAAGRNMFMPKPKPAEGDPRRAAPRRKFGAPRRRRD